MFSLLRSVRGQTTRPSTEASRKPRGPTEEDAAADEPEIHELNNGAELAVLHTHIDGPTLLWSPMAKLVSGATGVGSFYVRAGTTLGGWTIAAGREATLKSLEMSRAVVETVLLATGRDVSARRSGDLGRQEAENLLEKSITMLHSAISTVSFVTSLGFQSTQALMDSASVLSIQGLNTLNAVLGSTESSRAVAAIVTLIKKELNQPDEVTGEVAAYLDLLAGTVAFVLLQRWGRRQTAIEFRDASGEELIWDTVIDDKGFRADVVGTKSKGRLTASKSITRAQSELAQDESSSLFLERGLDSDAQGLNLSGQDQANLSDDEIRGRIMKQLPPGTKATITTDTMTLKKVIVQIYEGETAYIEPPPGLMMISESLNHSDGDSSTGSSPQQTIVFRTSLARTSSAEVEPLEKLRITGTGEGAMDHSDDDIVMLNMSHTRRSLDDLDRSAVMMALDSTGKEKPLPQTPDYERGPLANVKKSRKPVSYNMIDGDPKDRNYFVHQTRDRDSPRQEKEGVLRKALKSLSPNHSSPNMQKHDLSQVNNWHMTPVDAANAGSHRSRPSLTGQRKVFHQSVSGSPTPLTSPSMSSPNRWEPMPSYFSMHEKKRESMISQTDTFSVHSSESRPSSPTQFRTHARTSSGISKTKSHTELSFHQPSVRHTSHDSRHHSRSNSYVSSLYSMATKNADEAIILAPKTPVPKSIFEDHEMLIALTTDGSVPGMFPKKHLVKVIRRFARFATASYGNNFLRVMGLLDAQQKPPYTSSGTLDSEVPSEHTSFSSHTGLPTDCIILSSFFDSAGAASTTHTSQAVISPLAHFVSADHDQKAIVLTCRGTLGFEDILTDMIFDYDDLYWRGQTYHVHKGIHAAARRLLSPLGNRVMSSIKQNLEKHPDYGLVLCGHSLGGAVAALVAIMLSEPSNDKSGDAAFVTASMPKLLTSSSKVAGAPHVSLPVGRPIHAYAFGSPATVSSALRLSTRGLITTIINSNDVVPTLSLGSLHDCRSVALHLKQDTNGQLLQLRSRVISRVKDALFSAMRAGTRSSGPPPPENIAGDGLGEDTWAWTELQSLRSHMKSEKLLPPGECFVIETSRVFDRYDPNGTRSTMNGSEDPAEATFFRTLGRPATRVQFKLVRDVETRFAEVRFGSNMFGDHSPGRYEAALSALEKGVCDE